MSAAHILHFGEDMCHRVPVLRSAGYAVEECSSLSGLVVVIDSGSTPDLLCMTDAPGLPLCNAFEMIRPRWQVPVILFRTSDRIYGDLKFDLEVPTLTPPQVWLEDFRRLLAQSKALGEKSLELIAQSQASSVEFSIARERSRKLVQKVREDRSRWKKGRIA